MKSEAPRLLPTYVTILYNNCSSLGRNVKNATDVESPAEQRPVYKK